MILSPSPVEGFVFGHYDPRTNRAYITTKALMENTAASQEEIVHLIDHLLGSNGDGPRLSDGYGKTKRLELFGEEILALYNTTDPELLQKTLPKVYNMIDNKWFNEDF